MGDRANIAVEDYRPDYKTTRVYLYTHHDGAAIMRSAAVGLETCPSDVQYLSRVIFGDMTKADPQGQYGYGITGTLHDNEHPVLVISVQDRQTLVWFEDEDGTEVTKRVPAAEFVSYVRGEEDLDAIINDGSAWDLIPPLLGKPE